MTQSLVAWRVDRQRPRTRRCDRSWYRAAQAEIRIEPAPPDLPFRWMVTIGDRTRGRFRWSAVLRQVRAALDPGYATHASPRRGFRLWCCHDCDEPIPGSVLTGFLGSGKTTLLGHLLRQPEFSRTAVIINEFGEIGLDHDLIEASEDSFIELQTGCLCCKSPQRLDATTLHDLLRRRDQGAYTAFTVS